MVSPLPQSLLPSHTPYYTTESKFGIKPTARSSSTMTSTLASCPFTRLFPIGGTSLSSVRLSDSETLRVQAVTSIEVSTFVFGVVAIEVWHTELPVWAFVLALTIGASLTTPLYILYLVAAPPPIQHSRTQYQLVSFWLSQTRQSVLMSSQNSSSAICSLVDRLR